MHLIFRWLSLFTITFFLFSFPAHSAKPLIETEQSEHTRSQNEEDRRILRIGRISPGAHIGGGVVGTLLGFGLGHAIQGRYFNRGLVFTLGEALAIPAGIVLARNSSNSTPGILLGVTIFGFLRLWEAGDSWIGPFLINSHYRRLKNRKISASYSIKPAYNGGVLQASWSF